MLPCACQSSREDQVSRGIRPLSYVDRKSHETVRQQLDFSCAAASLATILTYYVGIPTSELDVLKLFHERYPDQAEWSARQKTGFSLDDVIYAAEQRGASAQAGSLEFDQLTQIEGPVIAHLRKKSFEHFVVVRKVTPLAVYISDPVVGAVVKQPAEFKSEFTGSVLAVWKEGKALPKTSPLQSIQDWMSVSDAVGERYSRPSIYVHPSF